MLGRSGWARRSAFAMGAIAACVVVASGGMAASASSAGRAASAIRAVAVPPNINATHAPGNQAEQTVAVNPTNPSNIVIVSNDPAPGPGLFEDLFAL